jgi:Na+-transporting NADH:ubiquinone oxidoreductase subunit A
MVQIKTTKGLDIPIKGKPKGELKSLPHSEHIALDLSPFEEIKFRLLVKPGDPVKIGQPLAEDKDSPGRMFVSPAGGVVKDVKRGLKRRLLAIVIELRGKETYEEYTPLDFSVASREEIIARFKEAGIFTLIRCRPFNLLANPALTPRSIFVKALQSAPFAPPDELQVKGLEREFQIGLNTLSKLTSGSVHLVYRNGSDCKAFTEAKNVQKHTAEGPHPVSNHSIHIHFIDPIKKVDDVVWTLNTIDVIAIGHLMLSGRCWNERVISIAGTGILPDRLGFFKTRAGVAVADIIAGRLPKGLVRLISGDVLTGEKVTAEDYLGFYDTVLCAIPENSEREFLHFFRLGADKYSFSRAYLSGLFQKSKQEYDFTTSQHGEPRPFIDSSLENEVMPLRLPIEHLVKAVMAEDYELAEALGLLEVDGEDFALATFVCPSKIEMAEIMKNGLKQYAKEILQ